MTLKTEPGRMFLYLTRMGDLLSSDAGLGKDDKPAVEFLLGSLSDGRLARRIIDAAECAATQHTSPPAQAMRSAVEAENSAT